MKDIPTLEVCRRQLENILYCCNQEPPVLVESIRAYAETALKRVNAELKRHPLTGRQIRDAQDRDNNGPGR